MQKFLSGKYLNKRKRKVERTAVCTECDFSLSMSKDINTPDDVLLKEAQRVHNRQKEGRCFSPVIFK